MMKLRFLGEWRERRRQRRHLKELAALAGAFATLDRLEQSGLLVWSPKERRMLIAQPLALLTMRSAETFQAFVQRLYLWTYQREAMRVCSDTMLREELAAVRKASEELRVKSEELSRADVERIRRARREQLLLEDMPEVKVEPFEFYIVGDSVEARAPLLAVGWFNPDTDSIEMATWEEVEPFLTGR